MSDGWKEISLEDLETSGVIKLGRGDVISKKDMEADPGPNPVYSSAENKNGMIGKYAKFMFNEELITWSVDGGGHIFYRPKHKFSVTNIGGWLRILDDKVLSYQFLTYALQSLHKQHSFDWQHKAHPSVIRKLYTRIPLPSLPEQKRIVDIISSVDSYIEALQQQIESAKRSRNAVLHELLTAGGDDWETTTIDDISDFVSVRKSPEQLSSDSIYVGLEHLEPNNTSIDNFDSVSKVTSSLTPFDVGDVLFGRLRPYLHKVAIAEMFGFCSPEILVLRANSKVLPQMLLLFCDADSTIKICVERSAGTRMPRTSTEDLASIEIKLPPIVEQIKLAELSSTFDTDISHLGIALEKSKILRSGLLSDLLSGTHEIPTTYDKVIGAA
jgi:type I restriction enzyme S subunit